LTSAAYKSIDEEPPHKFMVKGLNVLHFGIEINAGKMGVNLFFNINNITDSLYIERSRDGYTHDKASFTGYWGNGRNFNFGIRLSI